MNRQNQHYIKKFGGIDIARQSKSYVYRWKDNFDGIDKSPNKKAYYFVLMIILWIKIYDIQ